MSKLTQILNGDIVITDVATVKNSENISGVVKPAITSLVYQNQDDLIIQNSKSDSEADKSDIVVTNVDNNIGSAFNSKLMKVHEYESISAPNIISAVKPALLNSNDDSNNNNDGEDEEIKSGQIVETIWEINVTNMDNIGDHVTNIEFGTTESKDTALRIGNNIFSSGGVGVTDHRKLSHRDDVDQHPIGAITGLWSALNDIDTNKQDKIDNLDDIIRGAAAGLTAVQPNAISDMATQTWVGRQGFLKSVPVLSVNGKKGAVVLTASDLGIGSVFTLKGSKPTKTALPVSGNVIGDVWYVVDESVGYIWLNDGQTDRWEQLGLSVDLSNYVTTTTLANTLAGYVKKVTGKDLSTNDFTDSLKAKLDELTLITEDTISGWGFTKNTGTYSKPVDGIPKTDLSSDVRISLIKADSALQSIPDTYRTAADQDEIDAGKQNKVDIRLITIAPSDWSGETTCVKSVDGVTTESIIVADYIDGGIECAGHGDGTLTFVAPYTPTVTITARVIII